MDHSLTVGKPSAVLWKFCLPLFGSVLFQQLYNIADSLVAGKYIGEYALAAVGNSYEITLIFIAVAFGCNMGCSVIVSRFYGAKQYEEVKTAVSTACLFSAALCSTLMFLGLLFCRRLLLLIQTPQELMDGSALYLDIYMYGLPFMFFYNIANGIFSAMGDSRTPFFFLAASSTANIFMDIFFVTALGMKIEGVAWATFLCQGVSCLLAMFVVLKKMRALKTELPWKRFSPPILSQILRIALPSTLQQSFISVGNLIIQGAINGFGASVIAGYAAAVKLNNLVITSFTTIGNGMSNYTAQNLGAGKPERVEAGFSAGLRMVWLLSIPLTVLYFFFGKTLLGLFMDEPTALAMQTGITFLRILSPFYVVVSAKLIADGILRGSGRMNQFMIATLTDLVLRVVLALLLSQTSLQATGIWCAWPIGWIIATAFSIHFYHTGRRSLSNF